MINKCVKYAPLSNYLSIDESMLPYYGRNNRKQLIANKPVRMGYKKLVQAEASGYVIQFDPYQGARNGRKQVASEKSWGLGEYVVVCLGIT